MWWLVFTAVDLYLGLVALDVFARSGTVAPEKLPRLAIAKRVVIVSLVVVGLLIICTLLSGSLFPFHHS